MAVWNTKFQYLKSVVPGLHKLDQAYETGDGELPRVVFVKQKMEFIPSSEIKCPKSAFYWVAESGKSNF